MELGYFLGARRTNIVVVGERPNVFFWTDSVRFTPTTDGLVEWLLDESHGRTQDDEYKALRDMADLVVGPVSGLTQAQKDEDLY